MTPEQHRDRYGDFSDNDRERHETARAMLAVLRHKAIKDGSDLDRLAYLAEHAQSERHRLRAAQALQKARQDASRTLAEVEGVREENLHAKGLAKNTTRVTHGIDVAGLPLDKLRLLAEGSERTPTPETIEVQAEVRRNASEDGDA